MPLPIVIIHRNYSPYLLTILTQLQKENSHSDVILLGDNENKNIKFVHHENVENYYKEANLFADLYIDKHLNFNDFQYELFCFQRWFILRDFMDFHGIRQCVHLDSDVMIYVDLSKEQVKFESFNFTLSKKGSGHNAFIKSKGINDFCNLLLDFYCNPELFKTLQSIRTEALIGGQNTGGICDMTLFKQYYQRYSQEIGSTSDIINGSVYDSNINSSDGFEMDKGIKKISWIDGYPFCQHIELNKKIKFNSLHLQGSAKKYIQRCFTGNKVKLFFNTFKHGAKK